MFITRNQLLKASEGQISYCHALRLTQHMNPSRVLSKFAIYSLAVEHTSLTCVRIRPEEATRGLYITMCGNCGSSTVSQTSSDRLASFALCTRFNKLMFNFWILFVIYSFYENKKNYLCMYLFAICIYMSIKCVSCFTFFPIRASANKGSVNMDFEKRPICRGPI